MLHVLLIGLMVLPLMVSAAVPGDSVGVKVVNGKAYVLYKIAKGDNLGRISREYGVSVATLEEVNALQGTHIQVGQVLMVPSRTAAAHLSLKNVATTQPTAPAMSTPAATSHPSISSEGQHPPTGDRKHHTVQKGETLYAISRLYGVSVEELKDWNSMQDNSLREGQRLWVSAATATLKKVEEPTHPAEPPKAITGDAKSSGSKPEGASPKPVEDSKATAAKGSEPGQGGGGDQVAVKVKSSAGVHVVKAGETLFGIARTYGMDVGELRKINRLENATIKEGQALRVKADSPENPHQGTALIEAIEQVQDTTPKLEQFPDLKVLTAPKATAIPTAAIVSVYKDKSSGKSYKRVEETGRAGTIQDFATDQTRFYAFHRHLPTGSYIRVDYPQKGQSILVEVINQLPDKDPYLVRLSAKCLDYLMVREAGAEVRLRYVVPLGE